MVTQLLSFTTPVLKTFRQQVKSPLSNLIFLIQTFSQVVAAILCTSCTLKSGQWGVVLYIGQRLKKIKQSTPGSKLKGGVYSLFSDLDPLVGQSPGLSALCDLLKTSFQGLWEFFSIGLFMFPPKYKNWAQSANSMDLVPVLEGLVKSWLRLKHAYY